MSTDLKFELTSESKVNAWGVTLFRIKAKVSFKNVKKGELGGWIESERLSNGDARVSGNAWVSGDAEVFGDARVSGDARVFGDAEVFGDARVFGNAEVYGDAWVSGDALVFGDARVSGNARVSGDARVYGNAQVYGDAQVSGNAWVYDASLNSKKAFTKGRFVGRNDGSELKLTVLHNEACSNWDNTYVLGDYEITDVDPPEEKPQTMNIGGEEYVVTPELLEELKKLKKV